MIAGLPLCMESTGVELIGIRWTLLHIILGHPACPSLAQSTMMYTVPFLLLLAFVLYQFTLPHFCLENISCTFQYSSAILFYKVL